MDETTTTHDCDRDLCLYYALDTGDGDRLTGGMSEHDAYRTAQRIADDRGETVYLYCERAVDAGEASAIEPGEIKTI